MAEPKKFSFDKFADIAVTLMLIFVILMCIMCVMQVGSQGYVQLFGYSFFRVATGSMEPTLPVGTLLITQQVDIESIVTTDIICFRSKDAQMLGRIITHRVVDILQDGSGKLQLLTKGDANLAADGYYVTSDNLVGRVIWNSEEGVASALMSILNSQTGFLLCIVFPILIVGSLLLRSSIRQIREGIDEAIAELEADKQEKKVHVELSQEEYMEMYERVKQELQQELSCGEIKYESVQTSAAGTGETPEAEKV